MSGLRVAVISDQGSTGGAGVSASRLARALRTGGHRVAFLYRGDFWADPDCAHELMPVHHARRWAGRAWALRRCGPTRALAQASWVRAIGHALDGFRPDVISLHNLHSAEWDIEIVEAALTRAPVVWTLHDMWPLTGSCALPGECRRFASSCDRSCPQAGQEGTLPRAMIPAAHRRRRHLFGSQPPLVLVAPSRWMSARAEQIDRCRPLTRRITHGLDLEVFHPLEREAARRLIGLPNDGLPVLLTSGHSLRVGRKGLRDLVEVLSSMRMEVRLLVLGEADAMAAQSTLDIVFLGRVFGDRLLPLLYGAADVLVHPSRVENLPLVIQEAMACGRPVVGCAVGGVPEMIVDGETGWLAAEPSKVGLSEALSRAFSARGSWTEIGETARRVAEASYSQVTQRSRYETLFRGMLEGTPPSQTALDATGSADRWSDDSLRSREDAVGDHEGVRHGGPCEPAGGS